VSCPRTYGVGTDSSSSSADSSSSHHHKSEEEERFLLPEPQPDEEAAPGLTSSTHPFFEGQQYPPYMPFECLWEVHFSPEFRMTPMTPTMSDAAPPVDELAAPGATPASILKERGRRPDPFTNLKDNESFRQQLRIFV